MSDLTLWKEQQLRKMKEEMDSLYERLCEDFRAPFFMRPLWEPAVDVSESEEGLVVKVHLPGFDPRDLGVTLSEDTLVIEGQERREVFRPGERFQRSGGFVSRLRLPCKVNPKQVEATYKDGTLKIVMAKSIPGGMKRVKVKAA